MIAAALLTVLLAVAPRAQAAELLFWDNYSGNPDSIGFFSIDGSGGGALDLTGVELDSSEGMAYDSVAGRLFVASYEGGVNGEMIWVNVDGSGAGVLNTAGAPVDDPMGIGVDPVRRTVHGINTEGAAPVGWARIDGSGGGALNVTGATVDGSVPDGPRSARRARLLGELEHLAGDDFLREPRQQRRRRRPDRVR